MEAFLLLLVVSAVLHGSGASLPFEELLDDGMLTRASDIKYRLPTHITPDSYKLTLSPNFQTFDFNGEVEIKLKFTNTTDIVKIHSKFLNIISATFDTVPVKQTQFDLTYDFVTFTLDTEYPMGPHTLLIKFNGRLQDDMSGFYRSYYLQDGKVEWMATTQFQPVHARKAFPCFDEPSFKATFDVIINCPVNYTCHSNMPRSGSTGNTYTFQKTPIMSTYLLAFIVSKFQAANATAPGNLRPSSILARPDAKNMGSYAFETGDDLTDHLNKYFALTYASMGTNMKLDHVAIPDFSAGAMENWGLVTYREAYLMYEEFEMTTSFKQRIATILAHEIVHMWFGNYITCNWWSNTWLNEGFARFFQYYATHAVDEKYGLPDQFIAAQIHTSMLVDTPNTSKPMSNEETNSPQEISNQFGTITYNKGASVIRMIENVMGAEKFKKGLQTLLAERKFDYMTPEHLFTNLNTAWNETEKNIKDIMSTWTTQSGYPLLSVSVARPGGLITLFQKRFGKDNTGSEILYNIPLTYKIENEINNTPVVKNYLATRNITITIPDIGNKFVLFNLQQIGFYRVNYDQVTWSALIAALNSEKRAEIHIYNRAQIVDDAFNLAREGDLNYTRMFDIVNFLKDEEDYAPWSAAFAGYSYLRIHFGKISSVATKLDNYILKTMGKVITKLGLEDKGEALEKIFRASTLTLACNLGHSGCISSSRTQFNQLRNNGRVDADLREHVYCTALRHGNAGDFEHLLNKHDNENVVGEQLLILGALGCTQDRFSIYKYLSRTLSLHSGIRDQDRMTAFNSALNGNSANVDYVTDYVIENFRTIQNVYGASRLRTIINNILTRSDDTQILKFENFLNTTMVLSEDERSSVLNLAESARQTNKWANDNANEIITWLDKNGSGAAIASFTLMLSMLIALFFKY